MESTNQSVINKILVFLTLFAIFGILLPFVISSSTPQQNTILTTKPAQPRYVYTEYIYKPEDLKRTIVAYHTQGYIMNNLIHDETNKTYFLVMVKY